MRAGPLAILFICSACTQSGTGVSLTIDPAGLMPDELDVSATYDGRTVTRDVTVGGAAMLTMLAQLPDETTSVTFAVSGKRAGQLVGTGKSGAVAVPAHHIVDATVVLSGGGGPPDLGVADLRGVDLAGVDAGSGWTVVHGTLPPTGGTINAMWGSSAGDVYAATSLFGGVNLLHSSDHGQHWTGQLANNMSVNLNGVGGTDANTVYLVGDGATVLQKMGSTWMKPGTLPIMASVRLFAVFAVSGGSVYAVGDTNTILESSTPGSWVQKTAIGTQVFRAVWGVPGHAFAVGSGGVAMQTTGTGWSSMNSHTTNELRAVFGTSATDVWAAGDGVMLHFDGNGNGDWIVVQNVFSPAVSIHAMHGAPGGPILATGSAWTILRWNNGWSPESSGLTIDDPSGDHLNGVYVPSALEAFAGGDGEVILHRP